jgi:hypothetical protein
VKKRKRVLRRRFRGQWAKLVVDEDEHGQSFVFGRHRLHILPSDALFAGKRIRVYREGKLRGRGRTVSRFESDPYRGVQIKGLARFVPTRVRKSRKRHGAANFLLPAWFDRGDIVRIESSASMLMYWLQIFMGRLKRA